jgi:hypothetical protein
MTAADVSVPCWETVLHTVEQDVLRTEALLLVAAADLSDPSQAELAAMARTFMEPCVTELPSLEQMPVVPSSLLDRVQALRERISQVRGELERAMSVNRRMASQANIARPVAQDSRARFIDTVA